jgi:hypothetical protein
MPTMTGGSDDARAPHDERTAVDAAWDELIGEPDEDGDPGQADARAVTVDHATTQDDRRTEADDEMARLMSGDAPKLPTVEPQPETAAASTDVAPVDVAAPKHVAAAREPTSTPDDVAREAPATTVPKPVAARETPPTSTERASRPSLRVGAVGAAPTATPREAVRAARPAEAPVREAPAPTPSVPWAWIGAGAIALGVIAYVATRDGSPTGGDRGGGQVVAPTPTRSPSEPVPGPGPGSTMRSGSDAGGDGTSSEVGTEDTSGDTGEPKPPGPRTGDPREPPPGTPPEIAKRFRNLPVGPADRPPVGGIGATGIHVDQIAMGSETQGATCRGRSDHFSVSAGDRAGVCIRVVHPREKEELQVLWQKHGGSTRRSKMVVLPMHAYRTRGYLVLRNEYIGDWTVRIVSTDGVELARHDFTVDP